MSLSAEPGTLPRLMSRGAVAGMAVAVIALGGLAVWSAYVTQREADGLARAGVQTTGQLRALQALYVIRTRTDELEDEFTEDGVAELRDAVQVLPVELGRMESGDAPEPARVAREARPLAESLGPAIERFLADPNGDIRYRGEGAGDDTAEDAVEKIVEELESLLNDSESDPADLLAGKLAKVNGAGLAVRRTAYALIPLGLFSVLACGWVLRSYRRRTEASMRATLRLTAQEARTDQLTGLPNRRAVLEEVDRRVAAGRPFIMVLADLNGFKHYNDTFGHPAGDALLRRLGHNLGVACAGHGFAARLGGDEFCVLADELVPGQLTALVHEALTEDGEGFRIDAVSGLAAVPAEAADAKAALGLADTRLYAAKAVVHANRRQSSHPAVTSPARTGRDATAFTLSRMLEDRYPGLGQQLDRVAHLAVTCADDLGLPDEEILTIERAAQLHDIGKVALPAAILAKRGALTEEEQQFMRRHSVIGERLLTGVENLEPVAAIVRATHERWDGDGYPDQLAAEAIPIGARIIAVADAFCAMTSERPHARARSVAEALAELDRCSGSQFDPTVVGAIADIVGRTIRQDEAATLAPGAV